LIGSHAHSEGVFAIPGEDIIIIVEAREFSVGVVYLRRRRIWKWVIEDEDDW